MQKCYFTIEMNFWTKYGLFEQCVLVTQCAVVSHLIGLDASNCNVSATFCDVTTPIPPMLF